MSWLDNWRTQIRKGYLELCLLRLIQAGKRLYGLEILDGLNELGQSTKEGTLYPILSRLTEEGILAAQWEHEGSKGHPRKFYSLTREGARLVEQMSTEFGAMVGALDTARKPPKKESQ